MKPQKKMPLPVIIRTEGVTRTFLAGEESDKKLYVLRGINLSVAKGEIIAIVGASGAGKSTLLHILGTLDRPTAGKVYYGDVDVFALSDDDLAHFRNSEIGFVFQFHHLLPEFSALENVAMPALIRRKKFHDVRPRAEELLREIGLAGKGGERPTKLSGGEQQRVAVARALMNEPRVVLADEPSGNLDTANAQILHDLLWELSRKLQTTFIVVTHNESLAKKADRVVRIQDGVIQTS